MDKTTKRYIIAGLIMTCMPLARLCSLSHVWGSLSLNFSANNILLPLIGSFLGPWQTIGMMSVWLTGKSLLWGLGGTYGIPTFFAALSWSVHRYGKVWMDVLLHLMLPAFCMVLFCVHPVASYAAQYSWYWFIPMILCVMRCFEIGNSSIFVCALSSTFVAHAVGSVLWAYTVPMTAEAWLSLIPIVAVERLTFVVGMVVVHRVMLVVVSYLFRMYSTVNTIKALVHVVEPLQQQKNHLD